VVKLASVCPWFAVLGEVEEGTAKKVLIVPSFQAE
jgi:hypothetical protein